MIRNAKSPAEIDAFFRGFKRFQKLAEKQAPNGAHPTLNSSFSRCITLLQSLRDVLEVRPDGDFCAGRFMNAASEGREFAPPADYSKRASDIASMYQKEADTARDSVIAALIERKSKEQRNKLTEEFYNAAHRSASVHTMLLRGSSNLTIYESEAVSRPYLTISNFPELIASHQWSRAEAEMADARQHIAGMPGNEAFVLETLLARLELQIRDATDEPNGPLQARLGDVKQPADLAALATEFSKRQIDSPEAGNPSGDLSLVKQLSALAAAWSTGDVNLLAAVDFHSEGAGDDGMTALRDRVEREVVSRWAEAPELNQGLFLKVSLFHAIDGLVAKLAAESQWRRALRLLKIQDMLWEIHGGSMRNEEVILAVRSFLTGINFEAVGLWAEAAGAYKSVLTAALDNTPVAEAVARLKVLAKEHPGEVKATRAQPSPDLAR